MTRLRRLLALLPALALPFAAFGVQSGGGFVTTEPTTASVTNWDVGWSGGAGINGWDYVGQVNGASGVYLGNGWVLTATHVGLGGFALGGASYAAVPGSGLALTNANGTESDGYLFRLASAPSLPALSIRTTAPVTQSFSTNGSQAVMIGYGGGQGRSWGANTVTHVNILATVAGRATVEIATAFGTSVYPGPLGQSRSITNTAMLTGGDSGGAAFIFNAAASTWELAGIHSAVGTDQSGRQYSFMVQLDRYAPQILAATQVAPVPEGGLAGVVGVLALMAPLAARRRRR